MKKRGTRPSLSRTSRIVKAAKAQPVNSPEDRTHFVQVNLERARELAADIPAEEALVVLGLACPVARSLFLALNHGQDPDTSSVPRGAQPTMWATVSRIQLAEAYEMLWNGVTRTVETLRDPPTSNARLILFCAHGGTSTVTHILGADVLNPNTTA